MHQCFQKIRNLRTKWSICLQSLNCSTSFCTSLTSFMSNHSNSCSTTVWNSWRMTPITKIYKCWIGMSTAENTTNIFRTIRPMCYWASWNIVSQIRRKDRCSLRILCCMLVIFVRGRNCSKIKSRHRQFWTACAIISMAHCHLLSKSSWKPYGGTRVWAFTSHPSTMRNWSYRIWNSRRSLRCQGKIWSKPACSFCAVSVTKLKKDRICLKLYWSASRTFHGHNSLWSANSDTSCCYRTIHHSLINS